MKHPLGVDLQRRHTSVDSPVGRLILVGHDDTLTAIYYPRHTHGPDQAAFGLRDDDAFPTAREQLAEYFDGSRRTFTLDLEPTGTPFQQRVWALLRQIPYGETRTYGRLAADLGDLKLTRAVGSANAHNPLSIVVPCHRVIGVNGVLTGYAGGLERKQFLLALESRATAPPDALF